MRHGEAVFIDSGAWTAVALSRDPRSTARAGARAMGASAASRARLHTTSIPVAIETFTFLDRNAIHDVARWHGRKPLRARLDKNPAVRARDLEQSWEYFRRADLHKLSTADATSFEIMKRARIHRAYSFDHHFALASFRLCHSLNEKWRARGR
jgi:predicted nucleic acid-binding protein